MRGFRSELNPVVERTTKWRFQKKQNERHSLALVISVSVAARIVVTTDVARRA
jgi:hypothetical protein